MKKGQYLIIQFVLFFLIGLSVFIAFGHIFKLKADTFREDVADSTRKLINSYISSLVINFFDNCKGCDLVNVSIRIENKTAEYVNELYLASSGLNVITQPTGKNYLSTIHNLNSTLSLSGSSASTKPIILTLTKNQNKLEVK
jgi:flagellar basal body-associated protein FliL